MPTLMPLTVNLTINPLIMKDMLCGTVTHPGGLVVYLFCSWGRTCLRDVKKGRPSSTRYLMWMGLTFVKGHRFKQISLLILGSNKSLDVRESLPL